MNLQRLLLILRGRLTLAVATFAAVFALMMLVTLLLPQQYIASASVVADSNKADPVVPNNMPIDQVSFMATQVSIIESDRVLQEAAKSLHFENVPSIYRQWKDAHGRSTFTAWLVKQLRKNLRVTTGPEGNVIDLSATWPDALQSAAIANALAQSYIDINIALKTMPAQQYAGLFDERARALRAELENRQQRLEDFQAKKGIIPTDERIDIESARLAELSTQFVSVQAQRQDSQSRARQITNSPDTSPEVLQSTLIAQLKAQLATAEAKQEDLQTTIGVNHPEYKRNQAEIDSLRARIASEGEGIALSLGGSAQINLSREAEINTAIEAQKKRLLDLKLNRDQAALLQNDVVQAQHNLDAVTQRLAVSSLESQVQQSNVVLLSPAAAPDEASSPNWTLNSIAGLLLALVCGLAAAFIAELQRARVRGTKDLEEAAAGIPILAHIGTMAPRPAGVAGLLGFST